MQLRTFMEFGNFAHHWPSYYCLIYTVYDASFALSAVRNTVAL